MLSFACLQGGAFIFCKNFPNAKVKLRRMLWTCVLPLSTTMKVEWHLIDLTGSFRLPSYKLKLPVGWGWFVSRGRPLNLICAIVNENYISLITSQDWRMLIIVNPFIRTKNTHYGMNIMGHPIDGHPINDMDFHYGMTMHPDRLTIPCNLACAKVLWPNSALDDHRSRAFVLPKKVEKELQQRKKQLEENKRRWGWSRGQVHQLDANYGCKETNQPVSAGGFFTPGMLKLCLFLNQ